MKSDDDGRSEDALGDEDLDVEVVVDLEEGDEPPPAEIRLDRDEALRDLRELQELSLRRAEGRRSQD